tara:strand:- start:680 stop:2446 length:1767 start_codon:yes stop_codon:yes gene_type:complete
MATWKKVIVSGSKADLNEVTASTANITTATIGTATISAGTVTGITDIVVADGGTGASTFTDGGVLLGSATDPITAMAVLGDSEMIVGDGSGDPVAESGATLRTSIGVGTGDSPTFTGLTLSGDLTVQGADIDLTNAATDIDLVDNNASALSFDASGKTGILEIVSTDNAEQVKMSGALEVIGNVSGSATSTGSFGELKVTGNVGIEGVTSDTILDIDSNSVSHIVHIAGNGATQFSGSVDVTGSLNATTLTQGGVAIGDTVSGSFATKASVSGSFAQKVAVSGSLGLVTGLDTGTTVISGSATSTASFAALTVADGVTATLSPISSDAAALGSTSNQWSDLFLADAGVINWDNGDMTLTNASNEIQVDGGDLVIEGTNKVGFGGAPSTDYIQKSTDLKIVAAADVEINAGGSNVKPSADDGAALGLSGTAFSDLFLASGGVVNWNEGDMTLTHSTNAITVGGGKLVVTGNLEVTGTTTTLQSTNLVISDQYAFLASGSSAANVDAGILVQSGSTAGTGSAIFHDTSAQRWAVAKGVAEGDTKALTSTGLVVTTTSGTSVPVGSTPEYGVGELYIDTDDGNEGGFWIYT